MHDAIRDLKSSLIRIRDITFDIDAQAAAALADRALAGRLETIRCALVVILTGYFESFLRDSVQAFISNVNSRSIPYATLPDKLRAINLAEGGRALTQRVKEEHGGRVTWITASSADIAGRLGSIHSGPRCDLVWEAFAQTRSNPNFEVVKDFLTRVGVATPALALEAATGLSHQLISGNLESLLSMRNESAHSGQPAVVPVPSTIRTFCDLLERIGDGFVHILCEHLKTPNFSPRVIQL